MGSPIDEAIARSCKAPGKRPPNISSGSVTLAYSHGIAIRVARCRTTYKWLRTNLRTVCTRLVRKWPAPLQRLLKRVNEIRRQLLFRHKQASLTMLLQKFPFSEEHYLQLNPDVRSVVNKGFAASGFEHFINSGIDELETKEHRVLRVDINGLSYDFDPYAYCADNPDVPVLIAQRLFRSPIEHFVRTGYEECRARTRSLYTPDRFIRCLAVEDGAPLSRARRYLALFAHYDRGGVIDDYVVSYLKALKKSGADICFITTVGAKSELDKVRNQAFRMVIKNDAGRDFGSWFLALQHVDKTLQIEYQYLLFINDSVYFPVADCRKMFDRMAAAKLDLWGITDSHQCGYHLQSYFLGLSQSAQAALLPWFVEACNSSPYMSKFGQIMNLEHGLSEQALSAGLAVGAFCPIEQVCSDVRNKPELARWRTFLERGVEDVNPSHALWDLLISHYGCPGLKIELLRDNPLGLDVSRWGDIAGRDGLDPVIVRRHLARIRQVPRSAGTP